MPDGRRSSQLGFSLIELLVVICIIMCLMVLLLPRVWPVVEKTKNAKTLASCKAVSEAFDIYARLHGANPRPGTTYDVTLFGTNNLASDVESFLTPDFIKDVPEFDAWKYSFEYYYTPGVSPPQPNLNGDELFLVRSPGSNHVFEGPTYDVGAFAPNLQSGDPNFVSDDIVCANGEVIRWPGEWVQQ